MRRRAKESNERMRQGTNGDTKEVTMKLGGVKGGFGGNRIGAGGQSGERVDDFPRSPSPIAASLELPFCSHSVSDDSGLTSCAIPKTNPPVCALPALKRTST